VSRGVAARVKRAIRDNDRTALVGAEVQVKPAP
jgi:hypothetical protein